MANLVSDRSLESLRSVFDCPFTLIDVGAAGGVNRRYWKNFRNLTVVGFEPDEREFSKLQQSEGQRWYQIALNSSDGVFDLNVTRHQTNTSLLEPNIELIKQLSLDVRDFDIIRKVPLRCQTLDRVCADHGIVPHVVKLDTQGTELDILKGGEACLRRSIFAVEAEVEFLPLYKNQALFTDVHEYVSGLGFQLMGFLNPVRIRGRECGDGRGASSHLLSSDALYFKSLSRMAEDLAQGDSTSLTAAIAVSVAYGYDGYAQELCHIARRVAPDLERQVACHLQQLSGLSIHRHRRVRDFLSKCKTLRSIGKRLTWYLTPA
jgi:FkbM family methyltransferase